MALLQHLQRSLMKGKPFITCVSIRCYSKPLFEKDIKKSVFISQSKDIYTNLALEEWLYKNSDFTNHHILMLWQSDPCVVIGRHQNPWLEANVSELSNITQNGVKLARRNSGGGTVYHDNGNLNLTFFTAKEHYNRKYNLEIITRALFREYGLKVNISPREDLTIRDYKSCIQVSGTAAKLGRPNAYHHCTLLVNANKADLSLALQKQEFEIKTNATKSIKSNIINLCEEKPGMSMSMLMKAIGWEYLRTPALNIADGGMELANKQKGFQMINPTDLWFPGLKEIRDHYESWDWCFGKTPVFTMSRSFPIPEGLLNGPTAELKITFTVENGKIADVKLYIPPGLITNGFSGETNVVTNLIGHNFSDETINTLEKLIAGLESEKDKFVTECLKEVVHSV